MSTRLSMWILIAVLGVVVGGGTPVRAQSEGAMPGGKMSGDQAKRRQEKLDKIIKTLEMAHKAPEKRWPTLKSSILDSYRDHLMEKNKKDKKAVNKAIDELDGYLEKVRGMRDTKFDAQKGKIAQDMLQALSRGAGVVKKGHSTDAKTSGGGHVPDSASDH